MVLTSFQRHSALSLHAKCKHTLICMSLLTQTLSVLQYITNKHSSLFTWCDVVFTAERMCCVCLCMHAAGWFGAGAPCTSFCALVEADLTLTSHSRMHLRQGWCTDSTANCTQPFSTEAPSAGHGIAENGPGYMRGLEQWMFATSLVSPGGHRASSILLQVRVTARLFLYQESFLPGKKIQPQQRH